jgi:uncharacterized protein with FMN-binding domain
MKRAILVSTGTLAGLAAVLTYSGADQVPAMASGPSDTAALGAPPALEESPSQSPSSSASPDATSASPSAASPSAAAATTAAAAPTKAAATKAAAAPTKAAAAPTKAATPAKSAAPKPTVAPKPAGPKDYLGPVVTHKYGKVQVGIRVQGGKITAAWAAVYPTGDSMPYTDFSIPVLKSQTLKAQSARIAGASGATETTQAWKKSLQGALSKAGI